MVNAGAGFVALLRRMREGEREGFLKSSLAWLNEQVGADAWAAFSAGQGRWRRLAQHGPDRDWPPSLLAEALDREGPVAEGVHLAVPLTRQADRLVIAAARADGWEDSEAVDQPVWALLSEICAVLTERESLQARILRLEAITQIAARWQRTLPMDELLEEMAQAATKLLHAERASIFLWDRGNKELVGRPALGIEGGELRIPDDTGVVGWVLKHGQPRRVQEKLDDDAIDRSVDEQVGFHTRSLVCVPLFGSRKDERLGAFEVLNKIDGPFTAEDEEALSELAEHASAALANSQEYEHLLRTRNQLADQAAGEVELIGECPTIQALRSTIERVADTDLAVLILGENGTGKEVVSRMIHYGSRRRHEPFVAVNCAAIPDSLLESELFGHEKGAFTDAHEARAGKFELAADGTLFLDEIGDMSLGGQARLLRVLEEKKVVRVGGSQPIETSARVLAATNQDLAGLVRQKRFREDLYFRLDVVSLVMPPLRERGDDIIRLAEFFLEGFSRQAGRQPLTLTDDARQRLLSHAWPGNVRELRNVMERVAYLLPGERVESRDLDFVRPSTAEEDDSGVPGDLSLSEATRFFQSEYIQRQIERVGGNMTEAARQLGLHRSNLYRKMKQLGMEVGEG